MPTRNLNSIQILRGLCAVAVALFHWRYLLPPDSAILPVISRGYFGVDVFFVISGFVITYSARDARPGDFMTRRVFRIVPIVWTMVVAMTLVAPASPGQVLHGLLFIPAPGYPHAFPLNPVQWSLTFEMMFYVLFAMAMLVSRKWQAETCLAMVAALAALDYMLPIHGFADHGYLLEFAAGVLLARAFVLSPLISRAGATLIAGALLSHCAVVCALIPLTSGFFGFGHVAVALIAALLVLERAFIIAIPRPLFWLGELSFAIYMSHTFVTKAIDQTLWWTPVYQHTGSRMVLLFCVTLLFSWALYVLIERPGIRLGRSLSNQPPITHTVARHTTAT